MPVLQRGHLQAIILPNLEGVSDIRKGAFVVPVPKDANGENNDINRTNKQKNTCVQSIAYTFVSSITPAAFNTGSTHGALRCHFRKEKERDKE